MRTATPASGAPTRTTPRQRAGQRPSELPAGEAQKRRRRRPEPAGEGGRRAAVPTPPTPPPTPPSPPLRLAHRQLLAFERDGFTLVRGLLRPDFVTGTLAPAVDAAASAGALGALRHRLRVLAPGVDAAALATPGAAEAALRSATGGEAPGFRQHFNLHRTVPAVADALPPLAAVAAQLLAAAAAAAPGRRRGVRLLSSSVFCKQPGDGPTHWHADGRMAPVDGPTLTAWAPLRPVAAGDRDSGLTYAAGSHRDVAFLFFYDHLSRAADLGGRGYRVAPAPRMAPGDVLFHDGWTLHAAGGQPVGSRARSALSASFFLDGATLLPPPGSGGGKGRAGCAPPRRGARDDEDAEAYAEWLPAVWKAGGGGGARAAHKLLPILWE